MNDSSRFHPPLSHAAASNLPSRFARRVRLDNHTQVKLATIWQTGRVTARAYTHPFTCCELSNLKQRWIIFSVTQGLNYSSRCHPPPSPATASYLSSRSFEGDAPGHTPCKSNWIFSFVCVAKGSSDSSRSHRSPSLAAGAYLALPVQLTSDLFFCVAHGFADSSRSPPSPSHAAASYSAAATRCVWRKNVKQSAVGRP